MTEAELAKLTTAERQNRINAIQVLLSALMISCTHHPQHREMILTKGMMSLHIVGATEQEVLTATVTADFIELPPDMMELLVKP